MGMFIGRVIINSLGSERYIMIWTTWATAGSSGAIWRSSHRRATLLSLTTERILGTESSKVSAVTAPSVSRPASIVLNVFLSHTCQLGHQRARTISCLSCNPLHLQRKSAPAKIKSPQLILLCWQAPPWLPCTAPRPQAATSGWGGNRKKCLNVQGTRSETYRHLPM